MAKKEILELYILCLICFLIFLPDKTGWSEILRIGTIGNDSQKEIKKLDDIMGSKVAFDDPFSTSGYFLPRVTLQEMGFTFVPVKKLSDFVAPDEVGYIFSNDDMNTIFWVLRGYVEVGATDNQHFFKQTGKSKKSLRIIHKTFSIPRQIVSYRNSMSPYFIERIKELLRDMEHMEEGKKALKKFGKTNRFDELSDSDQERLEKLKSFLDPQCKLK